jgi:uncharacterized membrane protein YdjX (TVP38/TMEM64 family)
MVNPRSMRATLPPLTGRGNIFHPGQIQGLFNPSGRPILRGMPDRPDDDAAAGSTATQEPPTSVLAYETPVPPQGWWQKGRAFVRRLGPAGPLAVLSGTFPPLGGFILIGFIAQIAPWLRAHQGVGLLIYVGGFSTLAALALLPTYACSILGGWTFGFWVGFPASMAAFCGASLLAYLINSRAAGDRVVDIIREHPKWEAVRAALMDAGFWKAFWIVTLLRLPPTSPFAAANFIMGTIRAPLVPFILGTAIGMAPRTGVVIWAAAHASQLNFKDTGQNWLFAAGLVVTVFVVVILGHYANEAVKRATAKPPVV